MVEFPSFLSVSLRSATHILQLRFLLRTFMVAMWSWHAVLWLVTQSCPTLCNLMACSPLGSSVHGDSPGKNTEVGCHALLQEIFPTQGLNPGLPHCRWIPYHLSHQGRPWILEWVAYGDMLPFPTQDSNQCLLHCRQILYQLSCQGSPVLLVDWLFYHYEMAHLLSDKFFIVVLCSLSGVNMSLITVSAPEFPYTSQALFQWLFSKKLVFILCQVSWSLTMSTCSPVICQRVKRPSLNF